MSSFPGEPFSYIDFDEWTSAVSRTSTIAPKMASSMTPPINAADSSSVRLVASLWIYSGPIIFVTGMFGNALILVVMTRRRMSGTSTSVHLSLMAIADMAVLCTGLVPDWIAAATGLEPKKTHPAVCKLEKFLFFTSGDTSIWILVIFTIDRFAAICFPLHRRDCCLPGRAKYYAATAFFLAVLKNLPAFWTRGVEYKVIAGPNSTNITVLKSNCGSPTETAFYYETYIRPWIALVIVNIIPFCIILFCNTFIIRALYAVQRMRTEQAIVSASDKVAKSVNNQLVFVNHSVNFFLYCMTGRRFRQVIVSLCRRKKDMRRRGVRYQPCDDSGAATTFGGDRTTYNSSEGAAAVHWTSVSNSISPTARLSLKTRRNTSGSSPCRGPETMTSKSVNGTVVRCIAGTKRQARRNDDDDGMNDNDVGTVRPTMSVVVEMAMTVTATSTATSGSSDDSGRQTNRRESGSPETKL